jgi:hypothetical protein
VQTVDELTETIDQAQADPGLALIECIRLKKLIAIVDLTAVFKSVSHSLRIWVWGVGCRVW